MKNESAKIRDLRYHDNKLTVTIKVAAAIIYAWSCFFWGGVTIINFYDIKPEYSYLATGFLAGSIVITVGIIMLFFRLYILQLPVIAAGGVIYLKNAGELIDNAARIHVVFKPSFEVRYLPVIVIIIFSVVLAMLQIWRLISIRAAAKEEYNNRPTGSILD